MSQEGQVIKHLVEQMKALNADNAHTQLQNIEQTQGLTVVISIYDNLKPAHEVLDELYEWAEENNEEVKELIEQLEQDMSWNAETD
ncbi:hypothetical protein TCA2_4420 [Paenibacillus sp. TCA20]|uniref:Uncharacterized protein n=1 Tax=Paenibacillus urinalis TaxID=521520 RepID=A0ABY7XHC9_9BACL|nr:MULTISPECIES: hypothetical protein [Paenibacillus]WDI05241.1 hypothetical protein PUW25_25875 [Paenibacillus urinalis]GAK41928.1 hypothetical protein TCA2_4420 [Paenibacillus sp. TCA20]